MDISDGDLSQANISNAWSILVTEVLSIPKFWPTDNPYLGVYICLYTENQY